MEILNLEGHPNHITGSRVTKIWLNGWIFSIGQSGEASQWRVCYQGGLPRLVYSAFVFISIKGGAGSLRNHVFPANMVSNMPQI